MGLYDNQLTDTVIGGVESSPDFNEAANGRFFIDEQRQMRERDSSIICQTPFVKRWIVNWSRARLNDGYSIYTCLKAAGRRSRVERTRCDFQYEQVG